MYRKRLLRHFFIAMLAALPTTARADVEPGNWELSVTTTVDGMPGQIGPIVQTRCLTPEEARDPARVLGCDFSNRRDDGNVFSFDLRCGGQVPMRGSGSVRYGAQFMEGELELAGDASGQKFATRSRVSGRRVGPCP